MKKYIVLAALILATPACAGTYVPVREPALSGNKHRDLRNCKHEVTKAYYAKRPGIAVAAGVIGGAAGGLVASAGDDGIWSLDRKTRECMEALGYDHRK